MKKKGAKQPIPNNKKKKAKHNKQASPLPHTAPNSKKNVKKDESRKYSKTESAAGRITSNKPTSENEKIIQFEAAKTADRKNGQTGSGTKRTKTITERKRIERERKKRRNKLIALASVCVLFLGAIISFYFFHIIQKIEVEGNDRFNSEKIMEISGLNVGKHILLANTSQALKNLLEEPYIKMASVSRVFPDKLVILIEERVEAAVIMGMNTHAIIDTEGYVLSIGTRSDYSGLLKVYGAGSSGYYVNRMLLDDDFLARTLVNMLDALKQSNVLDVVDTLDISNPLSIYLTTFDGLKVQVGQAENLVEKFEDFAILLPTLRESGLDKAGTLDLSAKGDPVYSPAKTTPTPMPEGSEQPEESLPPE